MQAHKSGLPQKCHSLGQVGCRLPSLSPGGDPWKHQQVTVLCCLAPGEEQEPHGDPVHCRLYWLAAIVAQGRIRSKLSHEKQPWIYKPNGKKYGLTLPGFAALSTGHGVNECTPFPPAQVLLIQPCRTSKWDANLPGHPGRLLATCRIHPGLPKTQPRGPNPERCWASQTSATHLCILALGQHEQDQPLAVIIGEWGTQLEWVSLPPPNAKMLYIPLCRFP